MSRHTLDRSTASSDRYSTASSTGGNSDGGRLSEPLINPVGAGGSALEPLLYAAVICEGILLAEGALVEPSAVPALRAAALKMEKGLQRAVSFCSQIERVPRMMATVPLVTIHTLKRHGHAFVVIALTAFEAELASRLCEEAYSSFASAVQAKATCVPGCSQLCSRSLVSSAETGGAGSAPAGRIDWARLRGRGQRQPATPIGASESSVPDAAFGEQLRELMWQHSRPERIARYRRVVSLMQATEEVASVMEETVDRLLANSQNLDVLEDKSRWLLAQASAFQRSTREVQRGACWRSYKLSFLIGLGCTLAVTVLVLYVLQLTGVIHIFDG